MSERDEEPSPPVRVASLALAIFIVACGLVWLSRENGPPPFQPQARERPRLPDPPADADHEPPPALDATARAAALEVLPPLPAPDTPLSEQVAVLAERAFAADPVAGCRVLIARARCRPGRSADAWCDALAPDSLPDGDEALRRTGPWMTPRQKVLLALMRPDGRVQRLADAPVAIEGPDLAPPYLATHAYEFLLEGFRAYDPLALEGLALIHSPRWQGSAPALPDERQFLFYASLLQTLFGHDALPAPVRESAAGVLARLPPGAGEEIARKVRREARLWDEAQAPPVRTAQWQALRRDALRLEDCPP